MNFQEKEQLKRAAFPGHGRLKVPMSEGYVFSATFENVKGKL